MMRFSLKYFPMFLITVSVYPDSANGDLWIDCHPDHGPTKMSCLNRGCEWTQKVNPAAPSCAFNESAMAGYDASKDAGIGWGNGFFSGNIERRPTPSVFGDDFQKARVEIEPITDQILRIQIIDQDETTRPSLYPEWRENLKEYGIDQNTNKDRSEFDARVDQSPFGFAVLRRSTRLPLIDTRQIPGFTFAKQYLQLSMRTPTQFVYGLGETSHETFKHDFNYRKWGLFSRDKPPGFDDTSLYGVHAFYLCVEDDTGNAHGVFFLNSHAINVALQPDPSDPEGGIVTFRTIGGLFELFIFSGPTPDQVIRQYNTLIGRPSLPPYWALGFQLSRWGYMNLTNLNETFDRNRAALIPQDTQVIDIDYMNSHYDFTFDPVAFAGMKEFIEKVHSLNMKVVLLIDPGIPSHPNGSYPPLEQGLAAQVFIKDNRTGKPIEGVVWPGKTYFPDFTKNETTVWWTKMIKEFYLSGVHFDGIWIDMNEVANFVDGSTSGCAENSYNNPPYNPLIYENIYECTLCLDADQQQGKVYEFHSLYGHTEAIATNKAAKELYPGKRPFILSRSTFAGSGKYTYHWTGDVSSLWSHMKMSIIGMLEFNMFGIPFVGADICGFFGNTTEEMCIRWSQLGAFYPFSRNHNWKTQPATNFPISNLPFSTFSQDQDPAIWDQDATAAIRDALLNRYRFLPYLYTLLYQAQADGSPVARPLFFEFPADPNARSVDDQFLWGSGLMIAPVLEPGATNRSVYFPKGRWFEILRPHAPEISASNESRTLLVDTPLNTIGVFLRGGRIIPWQTPGLTTVQSRLNDAGLSVGLDENFHAEGNLYWDDDESENSKFSLFKFRAWNDGNRAGLDVIVEKQDLVVDALLTKVAVYGLPSEPFNVTLDGQALDPINFVDWNAVSRVVNIRGFKAKLDSRHSFVWEYAPAKPSPNHRRSRNIEDNDDPTGSAYVAACDRSLLVGLTALLANALLLL